MKKMGKTLAFLFLILWALPQNAWAAKLLIPGGQVIGMELADNTVTVAAIDENLGAAAKSAGLQVGDRILRVDSVTICCVEDVRSAMAQCGKQVEIGVQREGETRTLRFCPPSTEKGPKLGVYLKEGVSGVGTVTYYDPESKAFGALGHGVNTKSGELLQLQAGSIYDAAVLSVKKGKVGKPGQLMGTVADPTALGDLSKNTAQGVFGKLEEKVPGDPLPIANANQVHAGSATIRSTVSGQLPQEYSVEILKIYPGSNSSGRNMLLRITDQRLLTTTGGIVQGMSGSPIIQDGKLVGAVTHVLVNDPTTGYGIFIENMLDAAA